MGSYAVALRLPGARPLFAAGMAARIGFGALTLPALLVLAERYDGFTVAGIALAGFGLTSGLLAPLRGRVIDHRGRVALVVLTVAFVALLAPAPWLPSSMPWLVVAVATLAGAVAPPAAAVTRRGWTALLGDAPDPVRTAAFSVDSVGEESAYVAGPALAALGIAVVGREAAFLAAVGLVATGSLILAGRALGRRRPDEPRTRPVPLAGPARATVVRAALSVTGLGAVIGLVDTAVPALSSAAGAAALGGVLLAVYTLGSVIGVLVAGRIPAADPDRRRVLLGLVQVVALLPLLVVREPLPLAIALVVAGLPLGPLFVTCFLMVDRDVPLAAATQAYAWVTTAGNAFGALAMALAGVLVDRVGAGAVLMLTPLAAALSGIPAALWTRTGRGAPRQA